MFINQGPANRLAQVGVQANADVADPPWFAAVAIQPGRNLIGSVRRFDLGDASCVKVQNNITRLEYFG